MLVYTPRHHLALEVLPRHSNKWLSDFLMTVDSVFEMTEPDALSTKEIYTCYSYHKKYDGPKEDRVFKDPKELVEILVRRQARMNFPEYITAFVRYGVVQLVAQRVCQSLDEEWKDAIQVNT